MERTLKEISKEIRKRIIRMHLQGTGVGSSLSIADILTVPVFRYYEYPISRGSPTGSVRS